MQSLSTYIISAVLLLICVYAVFSFKKKLRGGCCGRGDITLRIMPQDKDTSHYKYKAVLCIEAMTCKNCSLRIENAFNRTDKFYARVNLKKKNAELYSKAPIDENFVKSTVLRLGYTVTKIIYQ